MTFEENIKKLINDVVIIKSTVESTAGKIDLLTSQIENIKPENEELESKVELFIFQHRSLIESVNDLELYSRKNNLIIISIPVAPN